MQSLIFVQHLQRTPISRRLIMTIENNAVSRSPLYGADRVTMWLDRLASEAEFEELREHCTCLTVTND